MNIIHVMKDGSVRESVAGVVIQNKEFYQILRNIHRKELKK